jgi:site-specific DNA recombinase
MGTNPQAVEQPLDLNVPENKLILALYLAIPEIENDRRSLNTQMGMRRAKRREIGLAGHLWDIKTRHTKTAKNTLHQKSRTHQQSGWRFKSFL